MNNDLRQHVPPIPDDLKHRLTDLQLLGLRRIEGFGWDLRFVRRERLPVPIPVMADPSGRQFGVVTVDGQLDLQHGLRFRP